MSVSEVLESIRSTATSERDKGDRFERLIQTAFRTDRTYRERFTQVWLWDDWPDRRSGDIGIDLVARNVDGGYTAIQCKCYDPTHSLVKADIDSFFTESGRAPFTERIIVSTTDLWSGNAEKSLLGQQTPVVRLGVDDLDAMTIDWTQFDGRTLTSLVESERKSLYTHQQVAVDKVRAGFQESDRGKLIMACGTGKTFTALRIAEEHAGTGKAVLFLAPSIALVSQSLKEWTAECDVPIRPFAVCSDATAGKPIDGEQATPYDLPIPPTTNVADLAAAGVADLPNDEMTVVFSTYQSIQVVADAQALSGLEFALVICDEAHRTAGVSGIEGDDTAFMKVHDNALIPAAKRLYMTATPRIYKAAAKVDAAEQDAILASMDEPAFYGPEFHRLGFGEAVELGLLADYKVLILTVEEEAISRSFQTLLSENGELNLPDVAKFIGCLSGLAKLPSASGRGGFTGAEQPMRRAVAFWSNIAESKRFSDQFDLVAGHYNRQRASEHDEATGDLRQLSVPTRHVDGTTNIRSRRTDIRWLKETPADNECRVLTNAKCLTEGVDVPALDAVMFLKPRRSKIDIVQAVGRVMRKPPGKDVGYIILPVAVPAGEGAEAALDQNKDYDVVWDVLQALRSHDERFNAYINRIALLSDNPADDPDGPIEIIDANPPDPASDDEGAGDDDTEADDGPVQGRLFTFEEWTGAIYTKIVKKVGTRTYWEDWGHDVADIAARHESRINAILANTPEVRDAFDAFLDGLRSNLNESIGRDDAISMLSQHLITRPIFEALFGTDAFAMNNPVSQAMQTMVDLLDEHNLETETENLDPFYDSVRRRVEGIPPQDGAARQRIIKDLYGRFFAIAFPKVADSLGIVYTPIEVVDFIVRAVETALHDHFDGASLTDEGVHVLDPFTGTGTFITRVLQSGFIEPHDLLHKYTQELHANEILLLAYYIAAVNIEASYRQLDEARAEDADVAFPGIVLTDTFGMSEQGSGTGVLDVFPVNNDRASRQKQLEIRVILGNPPYSVGQQHQGEDNQNLVYPRLDESIRASYLAASSKKLARQKLHDSYIRAFRWASDRVLAHNDGGVIAFVTNGGFVDGKTFDGFRKTLASEFDVIEVFNLRGNANTTGQLRRDEGDNVFGQGSRAPIAVTVLVRRPRRESPDPDHVAVLRYAEVEAGASMSAKLQELETCAESTDPFAAAQCREVRPDRLSGDWINQPSSAFLGLTPLTGGSHAIFGHRSLGLVSNRDAWNWGSSRSSVAANSSRMVDHYNTEMHRFRNDGPKPAAKAKDRSDQVREFVDLDPTKFSWNHDDFARVARGEELASDPALIRTGLFRPFYRQRLNFNPTLNRSIGRLPELFPEHAQNLAICVPLGVTKSAFGALMVSEVPSSHLWPEGTILYPLWDYRAHSGSEGQLPLSSAEERACNVSSGAVARWRDDTGFDGVDEDLFFYIYGVLHSPDYRAAFAVDLIKNEPQVPTDLDADTTSSFVAAGRALSALHLGYETAEPWTGLQIAGIGSSTDLTVEKMRLEVGDDGHDVTIRYNGGVTVTNIPARALDYKIGSRSALEWMVEMYRIRTDTRGQSGIVNNPNDWASEHNEPRFILDLIGRLVSVSMQTLDIVEQLPPLGIAP